MASPDEVNTTLAVELNWRIATTAEPPEKPLLPQDFDALFAKKFGNLPPSSIVGELFVKLGAVDREQLRTFEAYLKRASADLAERRREQAALGSEEAEGQRLEEGTAIDTRSAFHIGFTAMQEAIQDFWGNFQDDRLRQTDDLGSFVVFQALGQTAGLRRPA